MNKIIVAEEVFVNHWAEMERDIRTREDRTVTMLDAAVNYLLTVEKVVPWGEISIAELLSERVYIIKYE